MVLFSHGYFLCEDLKEQEIMRPYVPLGILYLSAYLEEKGMENEVFDSTFASFADLEQKILDSKPQYLALYVNLMTKINVLKIMQFVKNTASLKDMKIILGGPEVKNHAENFLKYGADYLVIGEGEETMYELINCLEEGEGRANEKLRLLPGIIFLDAEGQVFQTAERLKIKNIDELPFPNRKKVDLQLYLDAWKKHHGQNAISVSTMRGCPYTCRWCSRAVYGVSYRRRSPAKVVAELQEIQANYAPDTLWFVDDVFTISHKWLREFTTLLQVAQLKIPYECITRADRLNEEVIDLLKESGCFRVWIGAESGSQAVIDKMDRRVEVTQVRNMIQLAQAKGIQAGTFVMVGYPGETEADIEETINHLKVANPDIFTITVAYPIKGTEMYQEVETHITHFPDWATSTDRDLDFKRAYPRKYYDFAVRRVVNEVNYYKETQKNKAFAPRSLRMKAASLAAKAMMWGYRNFN